MSIHLLEGAGLWGRVARPSLVDIPDLRQQRRQLLVLETQGKDLL